jgi:cysteine-rich repeat protein
MDRRSVLAIVLCWLAACASDPVVPTGDTASSDGGAHDSAGLDGAPAIDAAPGIDAALCPTPDSDGDGSASRACGGDDCDDTDPDRFPGHVEVCDTDGHDEDCDDTTYGDRDGDGDTHVDHACCNGTACGDDCDDLRAGTHPTATETCNDLDDDCDDAIDEAVLPTWYRDADGDMFGVPGMTVARCAMPAGYASVSTDCDDAEPGRNPGAPEVCDRIDNDCDVGIDEGVTMRLYRDADADGHGAASGPVDACAAGAMLATSSDDCDDTNASRHPGAPESCDMLDNDCDMLVDETVVSILYRDADMDGFGNVADSRAGCMAGGGYVTNHDDCDDTSASRSPVGTESCDAIDNDCDGAVDESTGAPYYRDVDADGHGDRAAMTIACARPAGYVASSDDCDDTRPEVVPGYATCTTPTALRTCSPGGTWADVACVMTTPLCDARAHTCVALGGACPDGQLHSGEECDDGNASDLDGCDSICRVEPGRPRPITPYSGGFATTLTEARRPTFRLASATGGVQYEVQYAGTRAFAGFPGPTTFTLTGTTGAPPADMPSGWRYWRARAISATGARGPWSVVWSARFGRVRGDLNLDGRADWATSDGTNLLITTAFGPTPTRMMIAGYRQVFPAGDLTCDGVDDILATAAGGRLTLIAGGTFTAVGSMAMPTGAFRVVGDVNGDNCDDLAVASGSTSSLFFGTAGFDVVADATLPIGVPDGRSGDIDGDGYVDLVSANGEVVLGNGGSPFDVIIDATLTGVSSSAIAADLDRDGYADLVKYGYRSGTGGTYTLYAGGAPFDTTADGTRAGGCLGASLRASHADLDGDGYLDIAAIGPSSGCDAVVRATRSGTTWTISRLSETASCTPSFDATVLGDASMIGYGHIASGAPGGGMHLRYWSGGTCTEVDTFSTGSWGGVGP